MEHPPLFIIREKGRYGFIDAEGNVMVEPQYYEAEDYHNGFARILINNRPTHLDVLGRPLLKQVCNYVGLFEEQRAKVRKVRKWGFIDPRGNLVVDSRFEDADDFSEGMAAVCYEGFYGYINPWGEFVLPAIYRQADTFSEGLAPVSEDGKAWGFIDDEGEYVVRPRFDRAFPFQNDLAVVLQGDQWGLVDAGGDFAAPPQFDFIEGHSEGRFYENFAVFVRDEKYGILNHLGEVVLKANLDFIGDFNEGMALVEYQGKFGYIDADMSVAIPPVHADAGIFSNGLAQVLEGDKWGFIEADGDWAIAPQFDAVTPFQNGLSRVTLNGQWMYINSDAEIVWEETNF